MNKIYSLVWNASLRQVVAVSELAKGSGGGAASGPSAGLRRAALALAIVTAAASLTASPGLLAAAVTGANQGIFVNDGTDNGCSEFTDTASALPPDWVGLTGDTANCGTSDKATQTNRTLFYNPAGSVGANSLTLGNELYVNGGKLGLSDQGSGTWSMRIGSAATLAATAGKDSIAIGSAQTSATNGATTTATTASGTNAIAIGSAATASTTNSLALGSSTTANGTGASAIGNAASAFGSQSTALGGGAQAGVNPSGGVITNQSIALGANSGATGDQSTALGNNAMAQGNSSIAVGGDDVDKVAQATYTAIINGTSETKTGAQLFTDLTGSTAIAAGVYHAATAGDGSVAFGPQAMAGGTSAGSNPGGAWTPNGVFDVAIGAQAQASGFSSIALGTGAAATADTSFAIGPNARASAPTTIAFGVSAVASATNAVAIGTGGTSAATYTQATGAGATAIGGNATAGADASGADAVAIGGQSASSGDAAVAIGLGATAVGANAVAIGNGAQASGAQSISMGDGNVVSGTGSGAFGDPNTVTGSGSYAFGNDNTINADDAFVLGNNVTIASGLDGAVAIGNDTTVAAANAVSSATIDGITYSGFAGAAPTSVVSVGAAGAERQITNVAAGRIDASSTDAINGSQLYSVADTLSNQIDATETHDYSVNSVSPGTDTNYNNGGATGADALAAGVSASATGSNSVAVGSSAYASDDDAVAVGYLARAGFSSVAMGDSANASAYYAVALGRNSSAGYESAAIGYNASASGSNSVALGHGAWAPAATGAVAVGYGSFAPGDNSTAVGTAAQARGKSSAAFGNGAYASGDYGVALGEFAVSRGKSGTALGKGTYVGAAAAYGTAVGYGAIVRGNSSAALGFDSQVNGDSGVAVGNHAYIYGDNGLALGTFAHTGSYTHPTYGNDAIALGDNAYAGSASGADIAMGASAQATGGYSIAEGSGAVAGSTGAIAIGRVAQATSDKAVAVGFAAIATNPGDVALGAFSTTTATVPVGGTTIGGNYYAFAGAIPSAALGVGGRQIQNVAAGQLSASSTDAVNGSQLFATNQAIDALGTIANEGWNLSTNGGTPVNVAPGDTVDISAGPSGNLSVTQSGTDLTIETSPDATFNSISIVGGPVISNTGIDMGGEKITNLAPGTDPTDAVNLSQLNAVVSGSQTHYYSVNDGGTAGGNYANDGATGLDSLAAGVAASALGDDSVAIGFNAIATNAGDVALGSGSLTAAANPTTGVTIDGNTYTFAGGNPLSVVSVGSAGNERQITNVAAGQLSATSTDAVNGSQLYATNQAVNALGTQVNINTNGISSLQSQISTINQNGAGMFQVSSDRNNQPMPAATGTNSAAGGAGASASGNDALAVGNDSSASGNGSTALGTDASATGDNSVAIGSGSVADEDDTVSVGSQGNERRITNVAAGVDPTDAVNVSQLQTAQSGGVHYDTNSDGSVNYESVTLNPGGAPTVVHNVADGTAANDAVNVGQLNAGIATAENWAQNYTDQRLTQLSNRAEAGIASAIAAANLPQPYAPNQSALSVGFGTFRGESGMAVGLSKISESGRYIIKANASSDTRGDFGGGVGAAIVW
jgi:autotransporter adhesin